MCTDSSTENCNVKHSGIKEETDALEFIFLFKFVLTILLTLRRLMSHICDISPLHGSECVPSIMKLSKCL